jgi:hypothetical protein
LCFEYLKFDTAYLNKLSRYIEAHFDNNITKCLAVMAIKKMLMNALNATFESYSHTRTNFSFAKLMTHIMTATGRRCGGICLPNFADVGMFTRYLYRSSRGKLPWPRGFFRFAGREMRENARRERKIWV